MRVLITGGAGFLGSAIAEDLLAKGAKVTIIDNFDTGSFENVPAAAELVVRDVATPNLARDFGLFERVYHFASPASPDVFRKQWRGILEANIVGMLNAIDCVQQRGMLLVASSSEAYGQPDSLMSEDNLGSVRTMSERGIYDESKRLLESMAFSAAVTNDFKSVIYRIFNTYGAGMPNDGRVINTFMRQAKAGEVLTVHGDGLQTRSFGHVTNTVDQIQRLADFQQVYGGFAEAYNVGNDQEQTVLRAAQIVSELLNVPLTKVPNTRPHDPRWRCADLRKTRSVLGELNLISLEEGIKLCV